MTAGEDVAHPLLRLRDAVVPYPAEPSDEEIAAQVGLSPERVVRFDLNTLGGGPLPGVVRALHNFDAGRVVEYGDQAYVRLRAALSAVTGAPPHRIIPGAGADELIRLVSSMVVGIGDTVVTATPTFPMYEVEARLAGATVLPVPRARPDRRQSIEELRAAVLDSGARLAWLCSPNNPTADAYSADEVARLAADLPAVVVVDAVYQELAEASVGQAPESLSLLDVQAERPNLLVLRSLAKAYGLAGARVGYLVVPDGLAERFHAARLPLPIGSPSEAAALGALAEPEIARERHRLIVRERERLAASLGERGWEVLPSVTNFLLVRPPDSAKTAAGLLAQGLVVRAYRSGPLAAWLRITARSAEENDRLLGVIGP